ncbi:MAG: hypothetical protein EOO38_30600 [Cytophagaceae bacterium]|nr:MAG: hypothetical protein EOO38_30600 [Cytophagaceae bacterium]
MDNVVFDARHSAEALANQNTISLIQHLDAISVKLAIDQTRAVYDRILSLVNKAGLASSASGGSAKKISRSLIAEKIQEYASESARPSAGGPGSTMLRKMQDAGLAQTSIASANEARYRYRSTVLQSSYMAPFDRSEAEACASAELQHLVAQMDAGRIEGGLAFHLKCLDELKELSATGKGSFDFLQGYMYSLTDRCLHRFGSAIA